MPVQVDCSNTHLHTSERLQAKSLPAKMFSEFMTAPLSSSMEVFTSFYNVLAQRLLLYVFIKKK